MVAIDSIVIGERYRKDLGDIEGLAASIAETKLLQPVVITPDFRLIAGERRIAAFRQLGRAEIDAVVVDLDDIVKGEWAENAERKAFTRSEAVEIAEALLAREREKARERQSIAGELKAEASGKLPEASKGDSRDIVGKAVGMSGGTYFRAREVVNAAKEDPERFEPIKEEMDQTGSVHGAYKKLKAAQAEPPPPPRTAKTAEAVAARDERIKRMAAEGWRVASIADAVGIGDGLIREKLRGWGVEFADQKLGGHTQRVNPNTVFASLIDACTPADEAVALLENDWNALDRERFLEWDEQLGRALEKLQRLRRRVKAEL
ncbi:MAG: ParB N-terminal domain-containing protein [Dehalococcoidia bacterium]|nr:ParB N-terminal domain-containing protein [Dehalococcoidia bacterium]